MPKFNSRGTRPVGRGPVVTERIASGRTHGGGAGYAREAKGELFLLSVSNMVGEATFYERASERDERFRQLVGAVAVADPTWMVGFVGWLRTEANMRSAAVVAALEAARARRAAGLHGHSRRMVDAAIQRADEPGEALAYWTSRYGRSIPKPVKRGIGDAVLRLGTEFNYVKWGGEGKGFSFADVLNLTHPGDRKGGSQGHRFRGPWQHDLFGYAVKRPHQPDAAIPDSLDLLTRRDVLLSLPVDERRQVLEDPELLRRAGITWEALAGWLQGSMNAAAWEAIIPSMGYMALIRNLRNFDEAGVSDAVAEQVCAKLTDPDQVQRSRQLPMRFLSAYRAAPSLRWGYALEKALNLCLTNVPPLPGRTLVLVDQSGSMSTRMSGRSELTYADAAQIFGAGLALRAEAADLVQFDTDHAVVPMRRGDSVLRIAERFWGPRGGTWTRHAVQAHYRGHDRVVIVTDEQVSHRSGSPIEQLPNTVPIYTWNLAGYRHGHGPSGTGNRHTFGGLSDAAFRMIPLIEAGRAAAWPWEQG
ncbi:TROVE domain-containing protein [Nocardiopsis synnemataformans]|uniref:TROVE domain-containing protein n=1 Tax=Nocardiopsis synnemataformans TaxID=61305 RepID=UPI003EBB7CF2